MHDLIQIPNPKCQITNNSQAPISNDQNIFYVCLEFDSLEFIWDLVLACLPAGRGFGVFLPVPF
jgi:hypothetical protein